MNEHVDEYGHLADPNSIMNPKPVDVPYAPCDTETLPTKRLTGPGVGMPEARTAATNWERRCRAGKRFMWGRCR
jgi:hypothetical protein